MTTNNALPHVHEAPATEAASDRHTGFDLADLKINAARASKLLKALSNEHRLLILCQLVDGEKSVSEFDGVDRLSQSALSQHLARLRREGLVSTRRDAQMIYYALANDTVIEVIEVLCNAYCAPGAGPSRNRSAA